jgi:LysR family transcriptional regulator for bpeEF and oprC
MDRLQAMRVFVRVAELGSFARAAALLELSRARVSEAVAALERSLGARLLHRTTRRLSLTDDGRAYHERAVRILADVDEAEALVVRSRGALSGRLRVDAPMALTRLFVVPALPRLLQRHPELALELRLENRPIDLLEEGVDCAISYGAPANQDLVARRVGSTHLVTCASPAYLARRAVPRAPDDLARHDCIGFLSLSTGRPSEWRFERQGVEKGYQPASRVAFNSMEACVDAAEAGLGLTQVLSSLAHRAITAGTLVPVLLDWAAEGPGIYLVYPPSRQQSGRMRAFAEFAGEVFGEADSAFRDVIGESGGRRKGTRVGRRGRGEA